MIETRNIARYKILNTLLAFPTIGERHWTADVIRNSGARKGDLVSMSCAPASNFYLSWVVEVSEEKNILKYLLESIENGELCWWENVGLNVYSREIVSNNPHWRWNDKQFALSRRLTKVFRRNGAHIILPRRPIFYNDNSVTLNVRVRHNFMSFSYPCTFKNYKRLTMKTMENYYIDACTAYENNLGGE